MHELDKIRIYVKKVLKREPNDHAQTIVFIFTNRIALGSLKKVYICHWEEKGPGRAFSFEICRAIFK